MIELILDHIWQSTLFVATVGLLTFLLKANSASVRYGLWLSASLKFLFPFVLLTEAGRAISHTLASPPLAPPIVKTLEGAAQPFSGVIVYSAPAPWNWELMLGAVWFIGFTVVSIIWAYRSQQLRKIAKFAAPCKINAQLPVKSSPSQLEPALVGILTPVLILPVGITDQLSPDELEAIVTHEVCHLRRRDNLTAALHMVVETVFWFYPLVWWLETRLVAERERACDEGVIAAGRDPQIYAEGILKVCKFYVQSPLQCASGVSGANLKQRMEEIMRNTVIARLNIPKKALLTTCVATALAAPLLLGLLTAPSAKAQAANAPHPGTEAALRHQIETIESKGQPDYDVMVPSLAQAARSQNESVKANYRKWGALKSITFKGTDNHGNDVYSVEFENERIVWFVGPLQPDGKVGPTLFFASAVKRDDNGPSLGLEAAIRRELNGRFAGKPVYEIMSPELQTATREHWKEIGAYSKNLGAVEAITFQKVTERGWDQYHATFANGSATFSAEPLTNGKLSNLVPSDIVLSHQP